MPRPGPCTDWLTGDDVADCCEQQSTSGVLFGQVASESSELLFELSGRIYYGSCERTVRPCRTRSCGCSFQVLQGGHVVESGYWGGSSWFCNGTPCGCRGLSRVRLSGYPVTQIVQVKIDGATVDPDTYRLDEHRFLTRVREFSSDDVLLWPACQALDLPDTQPGTFSVLYQYGEDPPEIGVSAAAQLACELYKACSGQECALPAGARRVTRQGVTFERQFFRRDPVSGAWRTGLNLVDAFLNAVNPEGLKRRPAFWSPASHLQYARPVGSEPIGT